MVHQYKSNGYNIVLDVNSGCVHVVDDLAYDVIGLWEKSEPQEIVAAMLEKYADQPEITKEEIEQVIEDVRALQEDGSLFSEDLYRDAVIDFKKRNAVVKALCLHVAHDCNLGCKYCFADEGEYMGRRALMSFEVGKQALDFLIQNSGSRVNLEVDFFGGEPLMNFDVVKQLVAYGRSQEKEHNKKFRFTITTNGVLLNDEILDFVNQEMGNIVLSIDGRKEVNDRMRPFRNGNGSSYDLILPKFKKVAESRHQDNYYVRGTYTHFNKDFASDVLHLADQGFEQISVEPVVAPASQPYAIKEEDVPELCAEYDRLAKEILARRKAGKGFNFFHFMIDLTGGPCIYKRISGCGAGTEYLAVTPWGDLYPCHQFVGMDEWKMGSVLDGSLDQKKKLLFSQTNVYEKSECRTCWAKFYCSGGCNANNLQYAGDILKPRLECAIMIKAALAQPEE